jgi:hypothetical protein
VQLCVEWLVLLDRSTFPFVLNSEGFVSPIGTLTRFSSIVSIFCAQGGTANYKSSEGAWRFALNTPNASWTYVPGAESFVRFQSACIYLANGLDPWTQTPTVLMFGAAIR